MDRPISLVVAVIVLAAGCTGGPAPDPDEGATAGAAPSASGPSPSATDSAGLLREDRSADSAIVMQRLSWVRQQRLDTLEIGALMARIGETFVGTPYVPQTLELAGEERLIVNLRALDCVTFVENVLALARTAQRGGGFAEFLGELQRIRYRTGEIAGYGSRLHYFSEWLSANERKGLLTVVTRELGGVRDPEPLGFMSAHRDAYRQLADDTVFAEIRRIEQRLAGESRYYIPEAQIAGVATGIRDGDIIGATSVLPGLDIAHTGLAIWRDGALHLMHAPLVGDSVEVSERPLAVRIQAIGSQDGIVVGRARDRPQ